MENGVIGRGVGRGGGASIADQLADRNHRTALCDIVCAADDGQHNCGGLLPYFCRRQIRLTPPHYTQTSPFLKARIPRAKSITRCSPVQIVLTPGSPSPFRARKPPKVAIRL